MQARQQVRRVRLIAENDSKTDEVDAEQFSEDLFPGQSVMLDMIDRLTQEILRLDREAENLCQERYPETGVLRQSKGVGALTALGFVLTLEDPSRFSKIRTVGAYLGLRPRLRQSGEQQPQLRITKAGDAPLRRYLAGAAQYILGPFGPDTELRRSSGCAVGPSGVPSPSHRVSSCCRDDWRGLIGRRSDSGEEWNARPGWI
jgi:transposase